MKKNELLHVHSLLVAIARQYDERGQLADDALDSYRALGVTPMSIRAPRDDHEDAVLALGRVLGGAAEGADEGVAEAVKEEVSGEVEEAVAEAVEEKVAETVEDDSDEELSENGEIPAGSNSE